MKKTAKYLLKLIFICAGLFKIRKRPERPKVIFVIAAGYLGDTFWALQTLKEIQKRYPAAKVFAGVRTPFAKALLKDGDYIELDSVPSDRTRQKTSPAKLLRDAAFVRNTLKPDITIDLMDNRYSALFAFMTRAYTAGCNIAAEAAPLYSFTADIAQMPSEHLAYRPRGIVRQFFNWRDSKEIILTPPYWIQKYTTPTDRKTAILAPGAGWKEKEWGSENFRRLAEYLEKQGFEVITVGSSSEEALCKSITQNTLCGDLELTLASLNKCALFVGNDSGMTHIAAASGIPTLYLFCATNADFSKGLAQNSRYIQAQCKAAPLRGEQYCQCGGRGYNEKNRMNIPLEQVIAVIEEMR